MRRPVEKVPVQTTPFVMERPTSALVPPLTANPGEIGSAGELVAEPPINVTPFVGAAPKLLVTPPFTVEVAPGKAGALPLTYVASKGSIR